MTKPSGAAACDESKGNEQCDREGEPFDLRRRRRRGEDRRQDERARIAVTHPTGAAEPRGREEHGHERLLADQSLRAVANAALCEDLEVRRPNLWQMGCTDCGIGVHGPRLRLRAGSREQSERRTCDAPQTHPKG